MNRVFLAIIGILMLASCNQSGPTSQSAKDETKPTEVREPERIRKHITFSGTFYQITHLGSLDIVFTEGDYSIEAEGAENMLNSLHIDIDSNVLTVSIENEESLGINSFVNSSSPVTLYISCPSLQTLAVCSTGSFKSVGPIHTTDMELGILDTGCIELDTVFTTGSFNYESSGSGNAIFHHIRTQHDCSLMPSGGGDITADVDVADKLLIQNENTGNILVSGKAHQAELVILEESNCVAQFDADQLKLTALMGNVTLKGKYSHKEIHQGKNAKVN